jgi:hypothetical protein
LSRRCPAAVRTIEAGTSEPGPPLGRGEGAPLRVSLGTSHGTQCSQDTTLNRDLVTEAKKQPGKRVPSVGNQSHHSPTPPDTPYILWLVPVEEL